MRAIGSGADDGDGLELLIQQLRVRSFGSSDHHTSSNPRADNADSFTFFKIYAQFFQIYLKIEQRRFHTFR